MLVRRPRHAVAVRHAAAVDLHAFPESAPDRSGLEGLVVIVRAKVVFHGDESLSEAGRVVAAAIDGCQKVAKDRNELARDQRIGGITLAHVKAGKRNVGQKLRRLFDSP